MLLRLSRSFYSSFYSFFGGSGGFVSVFRWFRSGVSVVSAVPVVPAVSVVSVVSFRWFRFGVSGFSTCPSKMHCFFKVRKHKLKPKSSKTLRKSILKLKSRTKRYCSLFSCKSVMCLYKSETHVMNCNCKLKLSADIKEAWPSPSVC